MYLTKFISPKAKIHVLGIPKNQCIDYADFILNCDKQIVSNFFKKAEHVINILGLKKDGYRIVSNSGENGCQEVPHFHIHILGGEKLNL